MELVGRCWFLSPLNSYSLLGVWTLEAGDHRLCSWETLQVLTMKAYTLWAEVGGGVGPPCVYEDDIILMFLYTVHMGGSLDQRGSELLSRPLPPAAAWLGGWPQNI